MASLLWVLSHERRLACSELIPVLRLLIALPQGFGGRPPPGADQEQVTCWWRLVCRAWGGRRLARKRSLGRPVCACRCFPAGYVQGLWHPLGPRACVRAPWPTQHELPRSVGTATLWPPI